MGKLWMRQRKLHHHLAHIIGYAVPCFVVLSMAVTKSFQTTFGIFFIPLYKERLGMPKRLRDSEMLSSERLTVSTIVPFSSAL